MTLESDAKFEEKLTCGLENYLRNLTNFHQSKRKFKIENRKCMNFKFTGELCVMEVKNDAKIEKELTCRSKLT